MATQHDGWLGIPFASDFGAAWGIILLEDIFDGTAYVNLREAVQAARAAEMRYVAFAPAQPVVIEGRTIWTTLGQPYKLYRRRGDTGLDVYAYLRHREEANDKAFLKYHLVQANDPTYKAMAKEANIRWRATHPRDREQLRETNAKAAEARRNDAELREKYNEYHREYQRSYYLTRPDKLARKREHDSAYRRQQRSKLKG